MGEALIVRCNNIGLFDKKTEFTAYNIESASVISLDCKQLHADIPCNTHYCICITTDKSEIVLTGIRPNPSSDYYIVSTLYEAYPSNSGTGIEYSNKDDGKTTNYKKYLRDLKSTNVISAYLYYREFDF